MPRLGVVFDTNSYRSLGRERLQSLQGRESSHGIIAYASYFVMMELLAHVADDDQKAQNIARASLKRLWTHCKQFTGVDSLRLLGDSEAQVPVTLFGKAPPGRARFYDQIGSYVGRLCAAGVDGIPDGRRIAEAIQRDVSNAEARFAQDLFRAVVQTVNPGATSWFDARTSTPLRDEILAKARSGEGHRLIASAIVLKAAREVEMTLSDDQFASAVALVQRLFPVPIHLYDTLVLDVIERGLDASRPSVANSLWDYQICFSTGTGARIGGAPIWLISSDNRVLDAALRAGAAGTVKSLTEYERLLSASTSDVEDAAQASVAPAR